MGESSSQAEAFQVDNGSEIITKIARLYAEKLLSDVSLRIGEKVFPAHRLILCASSDVFQVMLLNPNWSEFNVNEIVLQENADCARVFGDFLAYLYTGKITLKIETVLFTLMLADKYNVKDLVELCISYMNQHIVAASNVGKLITWLQYTSNCGHNDLASACFNFVAWNFHAFITKPEFLLCDKDTLMAFLQCSDLVVYDEFSLVLAIFEWLDANLLDSNQGEDVLVKEVMSCLRFGMLSPLELAKLVVYPVVQRNNDFFVKRMALGMDYHSGNWAKLENYICQNEETSLQFTPRLYTAEKWMAPLILENFPQLPPYHSRTLLFNTPYSFSDKDSEQSYEWIVEFYPKGVWFQKFYLIGWQGKVDIPGCIYRTVRLSLTLKDAKDQRFKVGIIIYGGQNGEEYVARVIEKAYIFDESNPVLKFDDLLDFDSLNQTLLGHRKPSEMNPHLVGPNNDILKLQVVILPFERLISLEEPVCCKSIRNF